MLKLLRSINRHLIWPTLILLAPVILLASVCRAELPREISILVDRYNDQLDHDEPNIARVERPTNLDSSGRVVHLPESRMSRPSRPRRYLGRSIEVRNEPAQILKMQTSWETVFYRMDPSARIAWLANDLRAVNAAPATSHLSYVVEPNFSPKTIEGLTTPIVEFVLLILRRDKLPTSPWNLAWAFRQSPLTKIFWRHAMPHLNKQKLNLRAQEFAAVLVARLPDENLVGHTKVHPLKFATTLPGGTLFHDERPDTEELRPVIGDAADERAHNELKIVPLYPGCLSQLK